MSNNELNTNAAEVAAENAADSPKAFITDKFAVKYDGVTVVLGISPKTGTLCAYSYTDRDGTYHSMGRFPVALYASQWKARAAVTPAVLAFIEADELSDNPKLATKSAKTATMGETLTFKAPDPVVAALATARSIPYAEAERIAKASGLVK